MPSRPLKIGSLPVSRVEDGCDDCIDYFLCLSRKVKNSVSIDGTPVDYCDGFVVGRGNDNKQLFVNIHSVPLTLLFRAITSRCFISGAFFASCEGTD